MAAIPILATKQTITLAKESQYGVSPGTGTAVPAYAGAGALFGWDAEFARTQGGDRFFGGAYARPTNPQMQVPAFRSYCYEAPEAAAAFWTTLLEMSGFGILPQSQPGMQVWGAAPRLAASGSIGWWLTGLKHLATGVRGSLIISLRAGAPIELTFAGSGRVNEMTDSSGFPRQAITGRVMTACNLGLRIEPEGSAVVIPKGLQSVEIQTNTQLVANREGMRDENRITYKVLGVEPTITCVFEANAAKDWWKDRRQFVRVLGGFGEGIRWGFEAPRMYMAGPPEWLTLESGALGLSVVFRSGKSRVPLLITRS